LSGWSTILSLFWVLWSLTKGCKLMFEHYIYSWKFPKFFTWSNNQERNLSSLWHQKRQQIYFFSAGNSEWREYLFYHNTLQHLIERNPHHPCILNRFFCTTHYPLYHLKTIFSWWLTREWISWFSCSNYIFNISSQINVLGMYIQCHTLKIIIGVKGCWIFHPSILKVLLS